MRKINLITTMTMVLLICCDVADPEDLRNELHNPGVDDNSESYVEKGKSNGREDDMNGYYLTYNGDGRWYAHLSEFTVWFWGPSPQEIAGGMQSVWNVSHACPDVNNPQSGNNNCYPPGSSAWGNGEGFTAKIGMCASLGVSPANWKMYKTQIKNGNLMLTIVNRSRLRWSGTNCSIEMSGKVIIYNCRPLVVTDDSQPSGRCALTEI